MQCALFAVYIVESAMCSLEYAMFSMQCRMCIVHYTVCSMQCTIWSIQCAAYIAVECAVCSLHYLVVHSLQNAVYQVKSHLQYARQEVLTRRHVDCDIFGVFGIVANICIHQNI